MAEKIYCIDCKYLTDLTFNSKNDPINYDCSHPFCFEEVNTPLRKETCRKLHDIFSYIYVNCRTLNKNNDCKLFEKKEMMVTEVIKVEIM